MKRRSNGEGTIFKRKNGRWEAQASVKQLNGSTKRVCVSAKSREAVREKLKKILEQDSQRLPYSKRDWTVAEYLDYWMTDIQQHRIRETTMSTYRYMIKNHIKPTLGYHKLQNLGVCHIRSALNELKKRGCSGAIQQKCLIVLTACLNCAMREEIIYRNVAQLVEKPAYTPKETMIWTVTQARHFLQMNQDHPQFIAFLLMLTYGLRRGEALGLRWCDIDFDNERVHMRQQIGRIDGIIMARVLKTKNSRRTLPLESFVRAALLTHAKKNGIIIPPFDPYFKLSTVETIIVSEASTPLEPRNLARCFHRLSKKAGLPRIKLHALRHTTATIFKDLNVPVKDVQLILGQAHITTTLSIYQHETLENHCAAIYGVGQQLLLHKK